MESKDSKRSKNFTEYDKNLLFEITQQFKHIIENKKTDSTNVKTKNEAWDSIRDNFNANCQTGNRSTKQLHALYDGMKKKARKNMMEDKKELYRTGGGIFKPNSYEMDVKIVGTMKEQFYSVPNTYDSSTSYLDEAVTNEVVQINDDTHLMIVDDQVNNQIQVEAGEFDKGNTMNETIVFEVVEPSTSKNIPIVGQTPKKRKMATPSTEKKKKHI